VLRVEKQHRNAAFFALHDLTDFAVESTLGFRCGFYGLAAQGWEIEDTTGNSLSQKTVPLRSRLGK
jgi:hypothetical protein